MLFYMAPYKGLIRPLALTLALTLTLARIPSRNSFTRSCETVACRNDPNQNPVPRPGVGSSGLERLCEAS